MGKVLKHCKAILMKFSAALSSFNQNLISISNDKTLKIWDVQTGNCIETLTGDTDIVLCCCFSSDDHFLVSGSHDKSWRIWDITIRKWIQK